MSSKISLPITSSMGETLPLSKSNSGRKKVGLKPGRSLMDWIRLTHSSKDLTSVEGKTFDVSLEELSKHNKKDDAWICLKGKVYNITPYLEYHPGGEDELMRGAGKDATDLFNQIHKWVNAESMLQKCYVGRMKMGSIWLQKATAFHSPKSSLKSKFVKSELSSVPGSNNTGTIVTANSEELNIKKPTYDWFQSGKSVHIVIFSKCKSITSEHVIIDLITKDLLLTLRIRNFTYRIHLELSGNILPSVVVKTKKISGSVEIVLTKCGSEEFWMELGKPLVHHNSFSKTDDIEMRFRPCRLISKSQVTHNICLFTFGFPDGMKMLIPIGHHVYVKSLINGMEITRSYTPVLQSLDISPSDAVDDKIFHLMIKIYNNGTLTPIIKECEVGSSLLISDYVGDFPETFLEESSSLIILAAGTGFTPMVKIIHWALETQRQDRLVLLFFFNKTENDIPWKLELESLSQKNERFKVCHILSSPNENWDGRKGRISKQLLQEILPVYKEDSKELICICGPTQFTKSALEFLDKLGYTQDSIYSFTG